MIKVSGEIVSIERFPNGESRITIPKSSTIERGNMRIQLKYESDADLLALFILTKEIRDRGLCNNIHLHMAYSPYSRMDRRIGDFCFSLKHIAEFINSLNFASVRIVDAHSDVILGLINRARPGSEIPELVARVKEWAEDYAIQFDTVYFPDSGAEKRYREYAGALPTVTGHKVRNPETGKIESVTIHDNIEVKSVIMIDDLCSYGGTFFMGAEALAKKGMEKYVLIVPHLEDAVFSGSLLADPQLLAIFTTNSMIRSKKHPKIIEYAL